MPDIATGSKMALLFSDKGEESDTFSAIPAHLPRKGWGGEWGPIREHYSVRRVWGPAQSRSFPNVLVSDLGGRAIVLTTMADRGCILRAGYRRKRRRFLNPASFGRIRVSVFDGPGSSGRRSHLLRSLITRCCRFPPWRDVWSKSIFGHPFPTA